MIQPVPIALLLALVMAVAWRASRRTGHGVLAMAWLAYAVYEFLMYQRVLCSGECNIRVDLLLIYPVLWIGTLRYGVAAAWRAFKSTGDSPP